MANIDSTASNTDRMREHLFLKQMRGPQQHEQEEDLSMCSNVVNFRLSVCLNGLEPQEKKNTRAATTSSSSSSSSSSATAGAVAAHNTTPATAAASSKIETRAAGEKTATAAEGASAADTTSPACHVAAPASGFTEGSAAAGVEGAAASAARGEGATDEDGGVAFVEREAGAAAGKQAAGSADSNGETGGEAARVQNGQAAADAGQAEEREKGLQEGSGKERNVESTREGGRKEESEGVDKDKNDRDNDMEKNEKGSAGIGVDDKMVERGGNSSGGGISPPEAPAERGSGSSNKNVEGEEEKVQHIKASEGGEVATLKDVLLANPTDKCLVSDVDEQMLINIFFNSPVRITSIAIRSTVPPPDFEWKKKTGDGEDEEEEELPEDGTVAEPKVIKVHSNNSNLDFSTVLDETPAQVITLTPQQLKGEERLPLRGSKFQRCSSLHLFIEKNQANAMHTFLNRICLFGYVNKVYVS